MRNLFFVFIFLFLSMQSCSFDHVSPIYIHSGKKYSKFANHIIYQNAEQYKENRDWDLVGSGGSFTTDVKTLIVHYWAYEKVNIPQARKLFIECVDSLLSSVNADTEIRPYLHDFPFTWKNIELIIAFFDKSENERVSEEYVAYVTNVRDCLIYSIHNKCTGTLDNIYKETYEQAEQIVRQNNAPK